MGIGTMMKQEKGCLPQARAIRSAFPRLKHLSITICPKLKGCLPRQLFHLKTLEICACKQLLGDNGFLHTDDSKVLNSGGHNMEAGCSNGLSTSYVAHHVGMDFLFV